MLKLNRLTDYAIVVLGQMSRDPGVVRTAAALSQATLIPTPTVAKILKTMASTGLVTSHRGAAGGYSLDRSAETVSVVEIIQALEGPIALTACVDGAVDPCDVVSACPMSGNWNRVNDAIRSALEGVSLADMLDPTEMFMPADRTAADADPVAAVKS